MSTSSANESVAGGEAPVDAPVHLGAPTGGIAPAPQSQVDERCVDAAIENELIANRLGIAGSLFTALQCRHAETAAHSFRVAVICSAWAAKNELPADECDALEVAALLHDVGKIGVADNVFLKAGPLAPDESLLMDRHWQLSIDILRAGNAPQDVLEIVRHALTWYDGTRSRDAASGVRLPLGARMLAIADAFDAMTSHQLYRAAMSREAALAELFRHAGTQFDPQLVNDFAQWNSTGANTFFTGAARRWLRELGERSRKIRWTFDARKTGTVTAAAEDLFAGSLLSGMNDAVVFVDRVGTIVRWNPGAERMTGFAAMSVEQRPWKPELLDLHNDEQHPVRENACPVLRAVSAGERLSQTGSIRGRSGRRVSVRLDAIPVFGDDGARRGAVVVLHDISSETSLSARCQRLHQQATVDPMTQTANRAEFNRVHELFIAAHQQQQLPCSLIITDIDRFKSVNDTYGHPAGDEVIKAFASLLKGTTRPGDLVSRYGGEEFVVLCADCDNATAAARAEEFRRRWEVVSHDALGGKTVTASFGVTEIQPGDTPESMIRRADRALYEAKQTGRNRVVQLGTGFLTANDSGDDGQTEDRDDAGALVEERLETFVPREIALEKLRGFSVDHHAEIVTWNERHVRLRFGQFWFALLRRRSDRQIPIEVEIEIDERAATGGRGVRTSLCVSIKPCKNRDRRREAAGERARQLLASLKAYLMAHSAREAVTPVKDNH